MLDDLFTYRSAPDRFLTVTNAANHDEDLAWFQAHAGGFDAEVTDAHDRYAMLAVQGPRAREIVQAMADAPLPARFTTAQRACCAAAARSCAGRATRARTGSRSCCDPADAPARCGTSSSAAARRPPGLAARDTLRLEVCFHLYGNDLMRGARPDRGRPGLVLQGGHGLHRRRRRARRPRGRARARSSRPSR